MAKKKETTPDLAALQEKFELFVFEMSDALASFRRSVAELGNPDLLPLDYSLDSLNRAEKTYDLVLDGAIQVPDTDDFTTRSGRYLGETLRRTTGGTWKLCADPKNLNYGLPCITDFYGMGDFQWSPMAVVFNYRARRKSGLFLGSTRRIVEAVEMHKKRDGIA